MDIQVSDDPAGACAEILAGAAGAGAHIVLTGGSSVMQGMVELGEEIFHMPVRIGVPRYAGGLAEVVRTPRYATAVGLLLEGRAQLQQGKLSRQGGSMRAVFGRMREWFQRNF